MSFKKNDYQQMTLHDSFLNLSPRVKKIVENSWCSDFANIVFPAINEEAFSVLYSSDPASRPNTPVNFTVGAFILKENSNLSDDELMESICCDVRYQYALHSTHLKEQPVSDRTFSRFRERLYNYMLETGRDLMKEEMTRLNQVYSKYMNLHGNVKRMDSLMVASRCRRMSRLEIIYATTANAVRLMDRLGCRELITKELEHYLDKDDYNATIYYCKGDDVDSRLASIMREAEMVLNLMEDDIWHDTQEYKLLLRVILEQTDQDENGNKVPKDKRDISPDSLQNPSDPDATFRKKAGKSHKGYVANIIEAVGEEGSLITDIQFGQNTYSDSQFCKDYINQKDGDAPETMIADGAYGGTANQELASQKNINLVTTSLTGKDPDEIFSKFELNEEGNQVLRCPEGHAPIKTTYYPKTGMCRALLPVNCCEGCPHREACKAKAQRKSFAVHVSGKMVQRAKYLEKLSTEEYRKLTRQRNAIEGIPSVLRRKYHIDDIPVYGLLRSRTFVICKAMAYNFVKLRHYRQRHRDNCALQPAVG